jgi:hypothetical protein
VDPPVIAVSVLATWRVAGRPLGPSGRTEPCPMTRGSVRCDMPAGVDRTVFQLSLTRSAPVPSELFAADLFNLI